MDDQPLIEASLEAFDELIMEILVSNPGKFDCMEFNSEIMLLVLAVTATEPAPENMYDRLDLSNSCLNLAASVLRHHGHFGFAALLATMVEKNEIALSLNRFKPDHSEPVSN